MMVVNRIKSRVFLRFHVRLLVVICAAMLSSISVDAGETVPVIGYIESLSSQSEYYKIIRGDQEESLEVQVRTRIQQGDIVLIEEFGHTAAIQFTDGSREQLGPDNKIQYGPYFERGSETTLLGNLLAALTGTVSGFRSRPVGTVATVAKGEGGPIVMGPLFTDLPRVLVAGKRTLFLRWDGGEAPYGVRVMRTGESGVIIDVSGIEAQNFRSETIELGVGDYVVEITDARNKVGFSFQVATVDNLPEEIAIDNVPAATAEYLKAWALAVTVPNNWVFEAYQRLSALYEQGYQPAGLLMEVLEEGKTEKWEVPASTRGDARSTSDLAPEETYDRAVESHALLIGISDYAGSGFPSLDGPNNDIDLMQGVLMQRFQIPDGNIKVLLNDQASHSGLERAFSELAERLEPGDMVYIHYSGHGSYTEDLNGDELTAWDQTWVSHGSRRTAARDEGTDIDAYDVLDDEIDSWLAGIFSKTDHVIFVSDSCHSASVTRGQAPKVRAASPDNRPHPLGKVERSQPAARAVRIGAARDVQLAAEFQHEEGMHYGVFTWYWARALDGAAPGATWDDLFERTAALVRQKHGSQQPQMEGDPGLLVFGGKFAARQPTVVINDVWPSEDEVRVSLDAGELAGITVGSIFAFHGSGNDTTPGARLEISKVFPQKSQGVVLEGLFAQGDLVVEESHAHPLATVRVFIAADLQEGPDQVLVRELASLVKNLPAYSVADSQATSDLVLRVMRPARNKAGDVVPASSNDALPGVDPAAEPEVWVLTPLEELVADNLMISMSNPTRGMEVVRENLSKLARIREFRQLGDAGGDALISVEVILITPVSNCEGLDDCESLGDPPTPYQHRYYLLAEVPSEIPVDSVVTFRIKNNGPRGYYLYVLSSGPDGEIGARFPYPERDKEQEIAFLASGESFDLFDDLRREIAIKLSSQGEEVVNIIASSQPIRTELLEQEGLRSKGAVMSPLERLLARVNGGTRGNLVIKNDAYNVTSINLNVVPKVSR